MATILQQEAPTKSRPAKAMGTEGKTEDGTGKEGTEKVRVSLDISTELYEKLQAMARDIHGTKSDVLRKSLVLMDVALEARKNGKKIGLADRSDQLTTEIIGI